ncbi:MAG: flagellar biosynthetic protein FliO [Pseudomonadota bacterium]
MPQITKILTAATAVLATLSGTVAVAAEKSAAALQPAATENLLQVTLGLLAVLAAIVATAWVVRRFMHVPGAAHGALKIVGGLPLGARERIVLVQAGETQLLVGVAPGRVQTLHVLTQPVALNAEGAPNFAQRFTQAMQHPLLKRARRESAKPEGAP